MKNFILFVIDDDADLCRLITAISEHEFFTGRFPNHTIVVKTHSDIKDTEEAVNCVRELKPDLVLLDYMLGYQRDACIASLDILNALIPMCVDVVLMTGLYEEDIRLVVAKEPFNKMDIHILKKPFSVEDLFTVIDRSIRKKPCQSQVS